MVDLLGGTPQDGRDAALLGRAGSAFEQQCLAQGLPRFDELRHPSRSEIFTLRARLPRFGAPGLAHPFHFAADVTQPFEQEFCLCTVG
ncbi:hypothetical protein D557_3132 [Bordetella holmesii 70147]|nr:hypothetical protein D557_3132 [Bordetella holmesii 70147]